LKKKCIFFKSALLMHYYICNFVKNFNKIIIDKKFVSLENAQLIIDGLEIMDDELFELRGGVAVDEKQQGDSSGSGCGCGCKNGTGCGCSSGSGCGCGNGGGCGCGCSSGGGCGCGCSGTA
jgi:hypothetical protein